MALLLAASTVTLIAPASYAGHNDRNTRYAGDYARSSTQTKYIYADVVDVDPIIRYVTVSRPERVCEQVEYRDDRYDRRSRHQSAGGTIAGGLIGGVIGRQIGGGKGRDAATIAGVLIGSAIGHDNEHKNRDRDDHRDYEVRTREQCQTRYQRHEEERIDGYTVTYRFQGETYTTRTEYQPGDKIRLAVSARPAPDYQRGQNDRSYDRDYRRDGRDDDRYDDRYNDYDD